MPSLADRIKIAPNSVFLFLGMGLVAFLFMTQGSGPNLSSQVEEAKLKLTKAQGKLKDTQDATQNKIKFQEDMERVSQTFRLALDYLPKELDIQDLLKKIGSEARVAGIELRDFKPKDSVPKDFYDEIPMEIAISGNYSQLVTFLANVGKLPRIINIQNVEISTPTFVDGIPILKLTGILIGYRYKEPK